MRTWAGYQLTLMHTLFIPEDGGDTLDGHPSRPSSLAARLFTVVINRRFYIGWICGDFTQAFMLARESTFLFCLWLGKVTLFFAHFCFLCHVDSKYFWWQLGLHFKNRKATAFLAQPPPLPALLPVFLHRVQRRGPPPGSTQESLWKHEGKERK